MGCICVFELRIWPLQICEFSALFDTSVDNNVWFKEWYIEACQKHLKHPADNYHFADINNIT